MPEWHVLCPLDGVLPGERKVTPVGASASIGGRQGWRGSPPGSGQADLGSHPRVATAGGASLGSLSCEEPVAALAIPGLP